MDRISSVSPELDNSENDIFTRDHANIAMFGFTGMNKKSRAAGAGESGGDFFADMAGFPHTHDNDAPFAVLRDIDRRGQNCDQCASVKALIMSASVSNDGSTEFTNSFNVLHWYTLQWIRRMRSYFTFVFA